MTMSIALKIHAVEADRFADRKSRIVRTRSQTKSRFGLGRHARAASTRRRRDIFRAVLFFVSGCMAIAVFGLSAHAGGSHVLVIPTDDGYGLSDCLTDNASCGPMVASAWCKAKGHGGSGSLAEVGGSAEASDVTGSVGQRPRGFAVTCTE
jgi:hypothetical protein